MENNSFNYFIDTADINYIRSLRSLIRNSNNVLGITTNPNAMSKIGYTNLSQWVKILPKLCELVTEIRGDNRGLVHVQLPSSKMLGNDAVLFAHYIQKFNDSNTKLALKIPPTTEILNVVSYLQKIMPVNVTGLSDCSTALSCCSYGVDYVSIIPGRMEEVGIDANAHLDFMLKRKGITKVITGSMRTVNGLANAVAYNTVPTIGARVWDKIYEDDIDISQHFPIMHYHSDAMFSPTIELANINLSIDFFKQMDELGATAYKDWKKIV
jgi:transaldolase